jgi:type VI protein secretion system component VasK
MLWNMFVGALDHVPLWVWLTITFAVAGVLYWFFAPIITVVWNLTPKPVKIALGAIGTGIGIYVYGRYSGARTARELEKQKQAAAVKDREKIHDEVKNLSDADLDKRYDKWVR